MLILPLNFIREEDKKTIGMNLYHLAKLGHLGLPVVKSVIAIPPAPLFEKILNKYLKHNFNIKDHLKNIKIELLGIPAPESLKSLETVNASSQTKTAMDTQKLWQNLLEKWVYEIMSKIERGEKNLFDLTAQLIVFSANFTAFGKGFFDEDRNHAVIKVEHGEINFQVSAAIENLIIVGNKKLLLPQIYYWGIEGSKVDAPAGIKIVKVVPFTQSLDEDKPLSSNVKLVEIISVQRDEFKSTRTATKIFLDYRGGVLNNYHSDGVVLNISKLDEEKINDDIQKIFKFDPDAKIIFNPDMELSYDRSSRSAVEQSLEFAKIFLFFRNIKKLDVQIVLPDVFSVDEFLNLKREFASLGIYSKGSVKIWKQFNTVADFLNIDDYLDAGFDGAIIDLDKISKIVCGVDEEMILRELRMDWLVSIEKFFKELGLSKIIKNKPVLITGKLVQNEELLNYFIRSGVWGVSFEPGPADNFREHIAFLEKQALKKMQSVKIQH